MSNSKSFSQGTNYYVVFSAENLKDLKLYLKSLTLPGMIINFESNKYKGLEIFRPSGSIEYNELNLKLLLDEDFEIYATMIEEILKYRDSALNSNIKPFSCSVFITSNKGNVIARIDYKDCFFARISDLMFEEQENNSIDLTIKYSMFEYIKL